MLDSIRTEYARYRRLVELALEQVADQDLHRRLDDDPDGNPIAVVVARSAAYAAAPDREKGPDGR